MNDNRAARGQRQWKGWASVWSAALLCTLALALADVDAAQRRGPPIAATVDLMPEGQVRLTYDLARPVGALHFAKSLGGYRAGAWTTDVPDVRWVGEGNGERVERIDGKPFDRMSFRISVRYRHLPKNYAPFSPFSEGSALIYSGHFSVCTAAPCDDPPPLPITVVAPGKTIGVGGRRVKDRAAFVSRNEGTNIFVGTLAPVAASGFVAIIDPGLTAEARDHLKHSLPLAVDSFAAVYGHLSFRPELYVSVDPRPRDDGHMSTQGGTLPHQIFMHFDGKGARERAATGSPYWLDWFFAHEAAHLFQQDKAGEAASDDVAAWIHEGGADAMAAIELARRGADERRYVEQRRQEAAAACTAGLAIMPLGHASQNGKFDLHYQCGLLIWLAMDGALHKAGKPGLSALNNAFFARAKRGAPWNEATFLATARDLGVPATLIGRIEQIVAGGYTSAADEVAALGAAAAPILPPVSATGGK